MIILNKIKTKNYSLENSITKLKSESKILKTIEIHISFKILKLSNYKLNINFIKPTILIGIYFNATPFQKIELLHNGANFIGFKNFDLKILKRTNNTILLFTTENLISQLLPLIKNFNNIILLPINISTNYLNILKNLKIYKMSEKKKFINSIIKSDKSGTFHGKIGKTSLSYLDLKFNLITLITTFNTLLKEKNISENNYKSFYICTTRNKAIKVDISTFKNFIK
uniref:Ribosomal protein L1 n=1 Tax=Spumella sp. NIES-1846 TaxID=2490549 RepID=A0A455REL9_9STRA|nr:ribosomal protein L1 [Spumella sp. NIES-1846]